MPVTNHIYDPHQRMANVGRLLDMLVPRAAGFHFYDRDRHRTWTSSDAEDNEIDHFVREQGFDVLRARWSSRSHLKRTLDSGRSVIAVPVTDSHASLAGLLAVVFSRNDGQSSGFDPVAVQHAVEPVVAVLAELLSASEDLSRAVNAYARIDDELKLVYSIDQKIHASSRRHAGLAELVGQSGRFLGVAYSVLLLPSKRIRISATHSTWKTVNRRAVDKYVVETLFPQLHGKSGSVVYDIKAIQGSDHPIDQGYQALLSPLLDADGNLEGVIAQFDRVGGKSFTDSNKRFMSNIVRKIEYVIEQSFDPMTGLMNRAGFEAQLRESAGTLVAPDASHQIVYFDLDNLQLVNDTFGQEAGDQVIMRFARVLENEMPRNAVATRLAGDDFAVLITDANTEKALEVACAVRACSDQLRYLQGSNTLQVTVSTGISAVTPDFESGDALTAARIACDKAKDHGRDRIEVHDEDDQSIIRRYDDMQLVTRIQRALDNDEFVLMAQPIVDAANRDREPRYEILLRMRDAAGIDIPSLSFISAAERYHLMPHIDRWVISATIRAIRSMTAVLEARDIAFAVNLSGQSIGDDEMLNFIVHELKAAEIPTSLLCFEITESAAVSNLRKAQAFIERLRALGCRFALDDFGAGLSSFAYLKNLEVDILKIDGGFIRDIATDRISRSMVAAITQVADVMNLKTVAEYVGDKETQVLLTSMGVNFLQGHGIGRPTDLYGVLENIRAARKTA